MRKIIYKRTKINKNEKTCYRCVKFDGQDFIETNFAIASTEKTSKKPACCTNILFHSNKFVWKPIYRAFDWFWTIKALFHIPGIPPTQCTPTKISYVPTTVKRRVIGKQTKSHRDRHDSVSGILCSFCPNSTECGMGIKVSQRCCRLFCLLSNRCRGYSEMEIGRRAWPVDSFALELPLD